MDLEWRKTDLGWIDIPLRRFLPTVFSHGMGVGGSAF
jgi:hypothetical protein